MLALCSVQQVPAYARQTVVFVQTPEAGRLASFADLSSVLVGSQVGVLGALGVAGIVEKDIPHGAGGAVLDVGAGRAISRAVEAHSGGGTGEGAVGTGRNAAGVVEVVAGLAGNAGAVVAVQTVRGTGLARAGGLVGKETHRTARKALRFESEHGSNAGRAVVGSVVAGGACSVAFLALKCGGEVA